MCVWGGGDMRVFVCFTRASLHASDDSFMTSPERRYYSWKHSEMLRLDCGGWVTETGDSQLPLLDSWQVQHPLASPMTCTLACS